MSVANILRLTRNARRISQVALASRLEISPRHVSFLETGRAQPSRELVVAWMRELEAPASVRNAALHEAGYSPHLIAHETDARAHDARTALMRIIDLHDPLPGWVLDADWRVQRINHAGRWLWSLIMPRYCEQVGHDLCGMDIIDAMTHEDGFFCSMRNAQAASKQLLRRLRLEALTCVSLTTRVAKCVESLRLRYGLQEEFDSAAASTVMTFSFDTPFGSVSFVTYPAAFGLPHDVTPTSLRCELWFPSDHHTRAVMTQRGGIDAKTARA